METKKILLSLPAALAEEIKKQADADRRNIQSWIRIAIENELNKGKKS